MHFSISGLSPWLAPVVSSIGLILSGIFLIELKEDRRKKHGPWVFLVIVAISVVSLGLAWVQIVQSNHEHQALLAKTASEQKRLTDESDRRQATIDRLQQEVVDLKKDLEQNRVLHPKPQAPVRVNSTFVEPMQGPGYPRTVHLTIENTTDAILPIIVRQGAAYVRLPNTYSTLTDVEEVAFENAAYSGLQARPFSDEKDLPTGNGGNFDVEIATDPLTEEQSDDVISGRILLFFLFQVESATDHSLLMESCVLMTPKGDLKSCTHHNRP